MNSIKTYQDLLNVKKQLESDLASHRSKIQMDVAQLKEDWKPIAALISGIGSISGQSRIHPILHMGINLLGNALLRNMVPLQNGWVARALMPMLTTSFSSLLYNKDGTPLFRKWLDRFKKHESNGQREINNV